MTRGNGMDRTDGTGHAAEALDRTSPRRVEAKALAKPMAIGLRLEIAAAAATRDVGRASPEARDDVADRAWKAVCDHVFRDGLAARVAEVNASMGRGFDDVGPGGTHEDDVRAYATALTRHVASLRAIPTVFA